MISIKTIFIINEDWNIEKIDIPAFKKQIT